MLLDDICTGLACIDLLKLDVEGYEMAVFQGGVQKIIKTKSIYFEICDEFLNRYGTSTPKLLAFLIEFRFFVYTINEDYKLLPVDQSFAPKGYHQNIIATRDVKDLVRRTGWMVSS